MKKVDFPFADFLTRSGLVYKALGLKDKLPAMTEKEQIKLLASDGMLIKRPIVVYEDGVLVGFREDQWESVLLKEKQADL